MVVVAMSMGLGMTAGCFTMAGLWLCFSTGLAILDGGIRLMVGKEGAVPAWMLWDPTPSLLPDILSPFFSSTYFIPMLQNGSSPVSILAVRFGDGAGDYFLDTL